MKLLVKKTESTDPYDQLFNSIVRRTQITAYSIVGAIAAVRVVKGLHYVYYELP